MIDFEAALKDSRASVTPELERDYEAMKAYAETGCDGATADRLRRPRSVARP